ncbi:hypothetical protein [Microbacterium sp. che218]|uniref:hypothetical protein n=1 Tax=Microbacterium sp. che218 TaxID=3140649 RepID=UPI00336713A0
MSIQRLTQTDLEATAVELLGLDHEATGLLSVEGLCASIRRAASLLCPATPRHLVDAVLEVLRPLSPDLKRDVVAEALDLVVGVGDLLELRSAELGVRQLYLAPPSYVTVRPGRHLLLGVRPNASPIVDESVVGASVEHEAHTRFLTLETDDAAATLADAGLHRVTAEQWARVPREEPASALIERTAHLLSQHQMPGDIRGLEIIDPTTQVQYYIGRWRELTSRDEGMLVGRRPQAFGAPVWCVVHVAAGIPRAVLDFPIDSSVMPGWDEARRLQAAIDRHRGQPQVFRVRSTGMPDGSRLLDLFAPLPSWAERYIALVGIPMGRSKGALLTYRVPFDAEDSLRGLLSKSLWMTGMKEVQEQ